MSILAATSVFDTPIGMVGRASGTTLYVNTTGSGGAYTSIQDAIAVASNGNTVFVYAGTYAENVVVYKRLTLIGEDKNNTIIDGGNNGDTLQVTVDWVNITGFNITGGGSWNDESGIEFSNVQNCMIFDNKISANNLYGIYLDSSSNNRILNNNISSNNRGIMLLSSPNNNISFNNIWNNRIGIWLEFSNFNNITDNTVLSSWDGIEIEKSSSNLVAYNTIMSSVRYGIEISYFSDNNITGNLISSNGGYGILLDSTHSTTLTFNIFENDGVFIEGSSLSEFNSHSILPNNIVNSEPLYYYKNLNNLTIDSRPVGQLILADCENISVNNIQINNTDVGIEIAFCSNISIMGSIISQNKGYGIYIIKSSDSTISGNNITLNNDDGIYFYFTDTINVTNNYITSNIGSGFSLRGTSRYNILGNMILNHSVGIQLSWYSDNHTFSSNTISNNKNGLNFIQSSNDNTISGNNFTNNIRGIYFDSSSENDITNNSFLGNLVAIYALGSNDINARYNYFGTIYEHQVEKLIYSNISGGIDYSNWLDFRESDVQYIEGFLSWSTPTTVNQGIIINGTLNISTDVTFTNPNGQNFIQVNGNLSIEYANFGSDTGQYTILFLNNTKGNVTYSNFVGQKCLGSHREENYFHHCTFSSGHIGSAFWRAQHIDLTHINASGNIHGIFMELSSKINILNSNSSNNGNGIYLISSSEINILNNQFDNNEDLPWFSAGIYFDSTSNGTIINNTFTNNGNGIYIISLSNNNTISNNNFSQNLGSISLGSSYGNIVTNCSISNSDNGIYLWKSSNSTITNTHISDCFEGLVLFRSSNNSIINNIVTRNGFWGVHLDVNSDYNLIQDNEISWSKYIGLYLYESSNNIVIGNHIFYANDSGINLYRYSDYNIITYNTIFSNGRGFYISTSSNNLIYHNEIINNTLQASDKTINGNQWDNGYPTGGNYWSDYTGVDLNSTPNQDVPPPDGIGDTPYEFDFMSTDNYPLIGPYETLLPIISLISPSNNSIIQKGTILDFQVYGNYLNYSNYSINGGNANLFSDPYNISTTGWEDGNYTIQIMAVGYSGNFNYSWFFFTIDSTKPEIYLNSPLNNSIIPGGTNLDFSIIDSYLFLAKYSINGGTYEVFPAHYDISTEGWHDGNYTVHINASDIAGNSNSSWYCFEIDSTPPEIMLNSPGNNSFIHDGIILDLSILDPNLIRINYSVNGGDATPLPEPFNISTEGWTDGNYTILIKALDLVGNLNSSEFFIVIDSTRPIIFLDAPKNNSVVPSGTILDFTITDLNLLHVNYSINGGKNISLFDPFDVSTAAWADGCYTVQISAVDIGGNSDSSWFFFIIDSTPPTICFDPDLNHSTIPIGREIQINISALDLDCVFYTLDEEEYSVFSPPYIIDTSTWSDGSHIIKIKANDTVGNEALIWFEVTVDAISPYVVSTTPLSQSTDFKIGATVIITFSEDMNQTNTKNYVTISPYANFTFGWDPGTILFISFGTYNLTWGTTYNITIDSQITDINGNPMDSAFVLIFTTQQDTDNDGIPDVEDKDDDNDGYLDANDAFPLEAAEWLDSDDDGIGNNADPDDDNDEVPDEDDYYPLDPTKWKEPTKEGFDFNIIFIILVIVIISIFFAVILIKRKEEVEWEFEQIEDEEQLPLPPPPAEIEEQLPPPPPPPPPELEKQLPPPPPPPPPLPQ